MSDSPILTIDINAVVGSTRDVIAEENLVEKRTSAKTANISLSEKMPSAPQVVEQKPKVLSNDERDRVVNELLKELEVAKQNGDKADIKNILGMLHNLGHVFKKSVQPEPPKPRPEPEPVISDEEFNQVNQDMYREKKTQAVWQKFHEARVLKKDFDVNKYSELYDIRNAHKLKGMGREDVMRDIDRGQHDPATLVDDAILKRAQKWHKKFDEPTPLPDLNLIQWFKDYAQKTLEKVFGNTDVSEDDDDSSNRGRNGMWSSGKRTTNRSILSIVMDRASKLIGTGREATASGSSSRGPEPAPANPGTPGHPGFDPGPDPVRRPSIIPGWQGGPSIKQPWKGHPVDIMTHQFMMLPNLGQLGGMLSKFGPIGAVIGGTLAGAEILDYRSKEYLLQTHGHVSPSYLAAKGISEGMLELERFGRATDRTGGPSIDELMARRKVADVKWQNASETFWGTIGRDWHAFATPVMEGLSKWYEDASKTFKGLNDSLQIPEFMAGAGGVISAILGGLRTLTIPGEAKKSILGKEGEDKNVEDVKKHQQKLRELMGKANKQQEQKNNQDRDEQIRLRLEELKDAFALGNLETVFYDRVNALNPVARDYSLKHFNRPIKSRKKVL